MTTTTLENLELTALTDAEMGSVRGGDTCSDLEKSMMVLALFGQEYAVAFLVGVYLVKC